VVTHRPEVTQSVDCVCRYAGADIQQLLPASFQQMFEAATDRAVTESLCVLYVAVTRAIHAWYAIIPPSSDSEKNVPRTQAGLLRAALADGGRAKPATVLYQHGDPEWFRAGGEVSPATSGAGAAEAKSEPVAIRLAPLAGGRRRGWERARPSGLEGGTTVSLQHLLAPARSAAFARGQLVHAWYEQILWIEDGVPDSAKLTAVAQEVLTAEPGANVDLRAEMARFLSQLASPAVAEVLSRRRYENLASAGFSNVVLRQLGTRRLSPSAQNERGFAIRDGDQLLTGFIDRLVLLEEAGQVVAAEIIDFKTDQFDGEDPQQLASKIAFYTPQLRAYQRAVGQMTNCPPERIVATLLFVDAGIVQPVG
jgi:ATP-dependent exoDNAse (exonuclease V) beta subunit